MFFFKNKTQNKTYESSDFGRVFGWWLCLNGERIADVNYYIYDISAQFWHQYKVFAFSPKFDVISYDPVLWCSDNVSLESRLIEGYYAPGFLMHPIEGNLISIRNAFLPLDVFKKSITR